MKLHLARNSGNSHKIKVLLSLLKAPYEVVPIDFAAGAHKTAAFMALNPRGEVPVLVDGETVLWDSAACLVYIARKHGGDAWLPADPAPMAEVMQWLALATAEIQFGLQYGRRGALTGRWTLGDHDRCVTASRVALSVLEHRLQKHAWLALDHPTIADIACFSYAETAPESDVPLAPYPGVRAWLARCKALPGWPERD